MQVVSVADGVDVSAFFPQGFCNFVCIGALGFYCVSVSDVLVFLVFDKF